MLTVLIYMTFCLPLQTSLVHYLCQWRLTIFIVIKIMNGEKLKRIK